MILAETRRDFANLQDRCRAEICKLITSKRELSRLKLPTMITEYLAEVVMDSSTSNALIPANQYDNIYMV